MSITVTQYIEDEDQDDKEREIEIEVEYSPGCAATRTDPADLGGAEPCKAVWTDTKIELTEEEFDKYVNIEQMSIDAEEHYQDLKDEAEVDRYEQMMEDRDYYSMLEKD